MIFDDSHPLRGGEACRTPGAVLHRLVFRWKGKTEDGVIFLHNNQKVKPLRLETNQQK